MELHPNFKLKGNSFTKEELLSVSYSLIKEGEAFEGPIGDFLLDWLGNSKSIQVQTSGSTGKPKTILLNKEHMVNSALATGEFFGLSEGMSALLCLPADYIAGKMMLVRAMVLGLELDYTIPDSTPLKTKGKPYDFCAMVPLQAENSLTELSRIEVLIIGGAPVSKALKEKLGNIPTQIFETYGMTETISHIAAKKITGNPMENGVFELLPQVAIRTDDRGCLVVDCPAVSKQTIVTNDLVTILDRKHFQWLGRWDNVINSGGIKLIPEEIERKLAPFVSSRFFITGMPDKILGQQVVLIKEGPKDQDLDHQLSRIPSLTKFEVPKTIITVPQFIETANGKIHRDKTLKSL